MKTSESKFGKAWLIQWGFHGPDEDKQLEHHGIKNKVVDFLNTRKSFETVIDYTENLYRLNILSFSEKAFLENYNNGAKNRKKIFGGNVPIFTHYNTDLYREMMERGRQNGLDDPEHKTLSGKWESLGEYIIVGHNPYLEAKKVYNLQISSEGMTETLEWEEILPTGRRERKIYTPRP